MVDEEARHTGSVLPNAPDLPDRSDALLTLRHPSRSAAAAIISGEAAPGTEPGTVFVPMPSIFTAVIPHLDEDGRVVFAGMLAGRRFRVLSHEGHVLSARAHVVQHGMALAEGPAAGGPAGQPNLFEGK